MTLFASTFIRFVINLTIKKLLQLVPERSKLFSMVSQQLIRENLEIRSLSDILNMASFLAFIMKNVCAPIRDQQVLELETMVKSASSLTDVANLIKSIQELLEDMSLDLVNFRLN